VHFESRLLIAKIHVVLARYKVVIDGALKKLMECYRAKDQENGWSFVGNIKYAQKHTVLQECNLRSAT
jgi:hypothetical protein